MDSNRFKNIHPRDFADKSVKNNLFDAIKFSLNVESESVKRNTTVFNTNRYTATKKLDDYETLKVKARLIKEQSISKLPELVELTRKTVEANGGNVFIAKTSKEANEYIESICKKNNAKLVVKSKSITSEEIGLNQCLEKTGIEIAETDLAEFILQISKEQPSHIVAPAIHQTRERISKLFKDNFNTDLHLETGEDLTKFARDILREKFIAADVGISGANLIAADTGKILLVESEGNIRLTTYLPAIHIAIAGIEKIIRNVEDFPVFIELLAASGTGQSLTSYTNIITPPIKTPLTNLNQRGDQEREFHLVLVDNGRMKMRDDPALYESLYCIRCSACMNVCANFQAVGGHAFGGECYTGGIGGSWAVGTSGDILNGRFAELCTGCTRCIPNCPVGIDIPKLNTEIKHRIINSEKGFFLQKKFFGNFSKFANLANAFPRISNFVTNLTLIKLLLDKVLGFETKRPLPKFSFPALTKQYRKYSKNLSNNIYDNSKVILFADIFSKYNNAEICMSVIKVFHRLGINIQLSDSMDDGRAALSQGLIDKAKKNAIKVAKYLEKLIDSGNDIIISEPSVLTMFRYEYESLLPDEKLVEKIKAKCYDPFEYLNNKINVDEIKSTVITTKHDEILYHGHCQLKSIGLGREVFKFFKNLGIDIKETKAECCGMAGSFGYKKEYYKLSKRVGEFLTDEINSINPDIIIASGTSCREQISDEIKEKIIHPIELLEKYII